MTIQFIENPPFVVDLTQYTRGKTPVKESTQLKKIGYVTSTILSSFGRALFLTLSTSASSFKINVLGFYGSWTNFRLNQDIVLFLFKTIIWSGQLTWCAAVTTLRLANERFAPMEEQRHSLSHYNPEIDMGHIQTNELELNASSVPKNVKVSDLETFFDAINFKNKDHPGYIPPTSRREATTEYTVEELKEGLLNFTSKVNNRVAFLGTPPAYDTPRLLAFYQQIEDAVRLSIHKSNQDLEAFQNQNGMDITAYDRRTMQLYKNILEDRARMVLDLAIAGKHCGARFMGEAMSVHSNFYGESVSQDGTLGDHMIELLAARRNVLAQRQIEKELGFNTHAYTMYYQNMGPILALPGSKNIIEHLSKAFDKEKHLKSYFKEYTVKFVIDTFQEEVKKSQAFRTKLIDWMKEQINTWNVEEIQQRAPEILRRILPVINGTYELDQTTNEDVTAFFTVLAHLQQNNIALPSIDRGWDQFLSELFALDQVKAQFPGKPAERLKKFKRIKDLLSEKTLGKELICQLKENILLYREQVIQKLSQQQKINEIKKMIHLPDETIDRILSGKAQAETVIRDNLDIERRNEFINHMNVEEIETNGLSKAIMEWLLVSHHIFNPKITGEKPLTCRVNVLAPGIKQHISIVYGSFERDLNNPSETLKKELENKYLMNSNVNREQSEALASRIITENPHLFASDRYRFNTDSRRAEVLTYFYESAAQKNSDLSNYALPDPKVEKVIHQKFRKLKVYAYINNTVGNELFKITLSCIVAYATWNIMNRHYAQTANLAGRATQIIINNAPETVKVLNKAMDIKKYVLENWFIIIGGIIIAKAGFSLLPKIPYVTEKINSINLFDLFLLPYTATQTVTSYTFGKIIESLAFTWNQCNNITTFFQSKTRTAATEIVNLQKELSARSWRTIVKETAPAGV